MQEISGEHFSSVSRLEENYANELETFLSIRNGGCVMKKHWISLVFVLSLALGSCAPSQTTAEDSPTLASEDTEIVSPITTNATNATTTIVTTTATAIDTWETYHNTEAGYSASYPAGWTVNESVGINGELITAFMEPNNEQGIVVNIPNGEVAVEEIPDMPNVRCQQVTISGLSGRRCLDTLTFNFSTTFIDQGKQYTIASSGKHADQNIYQRFLDNFTVTP